MDCLGIIEFGKQHTEAIEVIEPAAHTVCAVAITFSLLVGNLIGLVGTHYIEL